VAPERACAPSERARPGPEPARWSGSSEAPIWEPPAWSGPLERARQPDGLAGVDGVRVADLRVELEDRERRGPEAAGDRREPVARADDVQVAAGRIRAAVEAEEGAPTEVQGMADDDRARVGDLRVERLDDRDRDEPVIRDRRQRVARPDRVDVAARVIRTRRQNRERIEARGGRRRWHRADRRRNRRRGRRRQGCRGPRGCRWRDGRRDRRDDRRRGLGRRLRHCRPGARRQRQLEPAAGRDERDRADGAEGGEQRGREDGRRQGATKRRLPRRLHGTSSASDGGRL